MSIQNEFSSFKLLLKQLYSVHTTKVKELENEVKVLKDKLTEKERSDNNSSPECKRCIELEAAFKSCKKSLHDQSKLFENFDQKFSIFNSPRLENQDLKGISRSSNCAQEKVSKDSNFKSEVTSCDKNELSSLLLEESTITQNKVNVEKISVNSTNTNLLKKVMQNDENLASFDACTVTFPQHFNQEHLAVKSDSLVLAPDSLDTTPVTKKVSEIRSNDICSRKCRSTKEFNSNGNEKVKDIEKYNQENKNTGKRLSSEPLNDDNVKRCNTGKQVECNTQVNKTKDLKKCNIIPPKVVINEVCDTSKEVDAKLISVKKDSNVQSVNIQKKKNTLTDVTESSNNKNDTPKNQNFLNAINSKVTPNEKSPSLLPINGNPPLKIIDLESTSNDNDDFQELIPSTKSMSNQSDDSWDVCYTKKPVKKNRSVKSVKCTSKYKMTLHAPPLNYKKPSYKQTKLSKSIFKAKVCNSKSPEEISGTKNVNPIIIEEDSSPTVLPDYFQASTPYDAITPPGTVDIDATFIPADFRIESPQYVTTNVKKNAVEKSHIKNGSLFSSISFPEKLQSSGNRENLHENENEMEDNPCEDAEVKENMNSFDRLPVPEEPNYKYKNDVVRKKSEKKQLNGFDCKECEKYYSELGLSDKEKRDRMKKCSRHRGKFTPPSTPDHFWELEFPDTQECKARGYLNETQKVKLNNIYNI